EIAPFVALPSFDESKIGFQGALHHIQPSVKLACFFVLPDNCSHPSRSKECRNSRSAGANALRESPLRHQVQLNLALWDHLLQQLIFADVGADMLANLSGRQQQPHTEAIHANVVADRRKVLYAFAYQSTNEVLRNSAQPKPTHHDGGAIENLLNC